MHKIGKLITSIWFEKKFAYYFMWPLLKPLSCLFFYISHRRREQFLNGTRSVYHAPVPVIIVGNITVGGNGKTPVVIWLVETLQSLGYKIGVVSRGYGGKAPAYPYLVTDKSPSQYSGDEPLLIKQRTGACMAVSPARSDAVKLLVQEKVDFIIADDGLQHYALARDMELAVIDGERRYGNSALLPLGPLREPVSRLNNVDFRICNGGSALPEQLSHCIAIAGIGSPQRFFDTLQSLNTPLDACYPLNDHQFLSLEQLMDYTKQGTNLLMTEKDAVKCRPLIEQAVDKSLFNHLWYLPVSAVFDTEKAQQIIDKIIGLKMT